MKRCFGGGVLTVFMAFFAARAQAITVNLELSLLLDVSGSVDANEFNLQRTGYVNAFNNPAIHALISGASNPGGIAANLIYWSGTNEQQQAVPWTHIQNATDAMNFATAVNSAARPFSGSTAPGSALNFATPLFASNAFDSSFQVIDVSGDGAENVGANTLTARNNALGAGGIDRINGLPILGESGLLAFYQNNIQGGAGSFTLAAASFADFNGAILQKLSFEIGNPSGQVPEPTSALIWSVLGLVGFTKFRRRQRN